MQYVYAALLLHKLNKEINEDSVKKVIKATGDAPDEVKVKALVSALSEVNIEEALKAPVVTAAPAAAAAPAQAPAAEAKAAKKEKAKEEEAKKEEEALAGLSSLFG